MGKDGCDFAAPETQWYRDPELPSLMPDSG